MGQSERSLISLGRRMAELQDRAPEAQLDRQRGRARLLREAAAGSERSRARSWGRGLAAGLAAAAAIVALVAVVLVGRLPEPLRFEVGATQPGAVGAWIAAPPGAALPIRFSDGSELRLAPGGRARVASVSADGAELALERGALDLAVVHREKTRWLVRVGPFLVHVVGTRFEASWDPVTERCTVALREGAITISGPVVGEARPLRAGERLAVSAATGTLETSLIETAAAPAPSPPAPLEPPEDPPSPSGRAPDAEVSAPRASASPPASPRLPVPHEASTWRALAQGGKYKDALAAAEREGFDAICAAASALDLHALGDAARLGGDAARASRAFRALRDRFPGSSQAASAAFMLGRIAQDRDKDPTAAAAWLTRYLSEQPAGAFAAEASGRLVEARDRAGDEAGARRAAERYLEAYPGGSHAAYARSVLARGSDAGAP
jgi:TolA-binding protein